MQICWHKFARYWDVEHREIPMEGDRLIMTPEEVLARVDENTIGVVPTLGVTFTGHYEPVEAVTEALDELQARDRARHADPCRRRERRLPRSIHRARPRVGLPPAAREVDQRVRPQVRPGAARRRLDRLARRRTTCPRSSIFNVNYLGGNMPTFALNFSRPGGQIVGAVLQLPATWP